MKITLIPGLSSGLKRTDGGKTSMSLGTIALAAALERAGHSVTILDIDDCIYRFNWSLDHHLYQKAAAELIKTHADVYGFHVACGTLHHALNISCELKKRSPETIVTFGGPHATAVKEQILTHFNWVDYITFGEGDRALVEFVEYINNQRELQTVGNLTYRLQNGEVASTEDAPLICDLDNLPIPAYQKYNTGRELLDIVPIDVGRGCPYNCTFCSTSIFWKKKYRMKSVPRIIEEMRYVKDLFSAKKVFLMHDCLTADREKLKELCGALRYADLGLEWGCAARLDHLKPDTLHMLREANCTHLEIGIESGSELVRAAINKKLDSTRDTILDKLQMIHDNGISLILFFICGFPNETENDINATINMIKDALDIMRGNGFFRLTYLELFAGTEMYQSEKKKAVFSRGLIDEISIQLYSNREIELAQTTDLFPEFYYVNNEQMSPLYFRELSSIYSSVIKLIGTEFYHFYSLLLHWFEDNIQTFFETWKGFEISQGKKYREAGVIVSRLEQYLEYLKTKYQLPNYLDDVLKYEKEIYLCRQAYLRSAITPMDGKIRLVKGSLLKLNSNVIQFLPAIQRKMFEQITPVRDNCFYLIVMQTSEKIKVLKINEFVFQVLQKCDGTFMKEEAIRSLLEAEPAYASEPERFREAFEKINRYFEDLGVIQNL